MVVKDLILALQNSASGNSTSSLSREASDRGTIEFEAAGMPAGVLWTSLHFIA